MIIRGMGLLVCAAMLALFSGCTTPMHTSAYVPVEEEGVASRGVDAKDYQLAVEKMVAIA